jgi:predicted permease
VTARLARTLVLAAAWLAPASLRGRWREEWLAEIDAMTHASLPAGRLLSRAAGAPWDAIQARTAAARDLARKLAHGWRSDLYQTVRSLRSTPRHALAVVLCLATGVTVTVSVFSAVNALFYGEIPGVRDRASLVRLVSEVQDPSGGPTRTYGGLSVADYDAIAAAPGVALAGLAAEGELNVGLSMGEVTTPARAAFTSSEYFATLGLVPAAGRLLNAADDRADAPPVVVISDQLWKDKLAASADVVGGTLVIADREFLVVGITTPQFAGAAASDRDTEIFLPLRHARGWHIAPDTTRPWLAVFARLLPPATADDVQRSLSVAAARRTAERTDVKAVAFAGRPHGALPNAGAVELALGLAMMLAVPLTVLAVACLNVANLQLARATTRARELGVRLAIGASRVQIIRLLTFEAGLLACAAAMLGWAGTALVIRLTQSSFPLVVPMDVRVLFFALVLTMGVTMLSGVLPAVLATRQSAMDGLRHSARGGGPPHGRVRNTLVVLQIATSFLLLAGSSLFVRTAQTLRDGMSAAVQEQLIVGFDVKLRGRDEAEADRVRRDLEARIAVRPDVRAVSFDRNLSTTYSPDAAAPEELWQPADVREVTTSFAAVSDLQLLSGRWLQTADASHAVVVNERLARALRPDGQVLGTRVFIPGGSDNDCAAPPCRRRPPEPLEIVGVVRNQQNELFVSMPSPVVYRLLRNGAATDFVMRIRSAAPAAVAGDLRAIVRAIDPDLPWSGFAFGPDFYTGDVAIMQNIAFGIGGLGVLALVLAGAGLYAVMAYIVSLRQREFGIRMAIGARPGDLTGIVGWLAVRLTVIGVIGGLILLVPAWYLSQSMVVGLSLSLLDPWSWIPVIAMLAVVAVTAAIVPARRAARVDPIAVLRAD